MSTSKVKVEGFTGSGGTASLLTIDMAKSNKAQ